MPYALPAAGAGLIQPSGKTEPDGGEVSDFV